MTSYMFTIPGEPQTKSRPRFAQGGHAYTPSKTHEAEKRVLAAFHKHYLNGIPLTGEIHIKLDFWMSTRRTKDFDNLEKLVCDALNHKAFTDDGWITRCLTNKHLPSLTVPGKRGQRKRHGDDPLTTFDGTPYDPHIDVFITNDLPQNIQYGTQQQKKK
jgi:Holliday junction resolvase RusA-like endonuclease